MVRSGTAWLGLAAPLLLALAPAPARACPGEGDLLVLMGAGLLLPSELGSEVTGGPGNRELAPVIGWAYQVPVDLMNTENHHRVALQVDWTPGGAGADVRARLGYRYVRGRLELGLGASSGPDRVRLSPELGVRLGRWPSEADVHLRVRIEPAITAPRDLRGVMTVGWSMF
jgi:hypothetical protein